MRIVTALHPERRDRVRVDLDGVPWRTLPAAAVVSAGVRVGTVLDRERARELGRVLRRFEALDVAGKALSHRDRSVAELDARLERGGVRPVEREAAVETMVRLGFVDDRRMAIARARAMASRGWGNEAIRFDLELRGIDADLLETALGELDSEADRARTIAGRTTSAVSAVRRLAAKGFSAEAIELVAERALASEPDAPLEPGAS